MGNIQIVQNLCDVLRDQSDFNLLNGYRQMLLDLSKSDDALIAADSYIKQHTDDLFDLKAKAEGQGEADTSLRGMLAGAASFC